MQCLSIIERFFEQPLPSVCRVKFFGLHGFLNETRALREDTAGAERVVADFAVAHVRIGRHADMRAVCEEESLLCVFVEHVKDRRASEKHGIALIFSAFADTVENDDENRSLRTDNICFF